MNSYSPLTRSGQSRSDALRNSSLIHGLLLLSMLTLCGAAPPERKRIQAAPTGGNPLNIDGRLDEPAWQKAPIATDFIERTPQPGQPAAARTEFRVLYDENTVYVGLVMFTNGAPPRAWERARDGFGIFSDDAISLKFDVRLDARTTVGFATNPSGVQLDYISVENGGDFRREYDAIWDVSATVQPDRWTAEFAIPVIALGLPSGRDVRTIGLQVSRDDNARIATSDWAEMPPEFGPTAALYYGRIDGLEGLTGGNPLTLLPYALAGLDYDPTNPLTGDDIELKVGGDVRARWGRDIWTELTILTDFAQVDLDDPVVNANRFPLFFPERRPFFLSGLEVFDYGDAGFSQIFFSRRIGLDDNGNAVPLLAGFKSYGSVGDFRFGALQVFTDEQGDEPARSYSVARVRQNFGERGHVGLLATLDGAVAPLSSNDVEFKPNISFGGDGAVRGYDRRLELRGFIAGTINEEGESSNGVSGQGTLSWRGQNLQPSVAVSFISKDFDPTVGFVVRPDLLQNRVDLTTVFRPKGLQRLLFQVVGQIEHQLSSGEILGQRADSFAQIVFRNGLETGVFLNRVEDFVRESFTLLDRVPVAAGRYFGTQYGAYIALSSQRNPYFDITFSRNHAVFDGVRSTVDFFGGFNLSGYARTEITASLSWFEFEGFDTIQTTTINGKISITPTTLLVIDLIGQANTFEKRVTPLVRLRWRYLPGSDLFVVYRETIPYGDSTQPAERSLTAKINYRFDSLF